MEGHLPHTCPVRISFLPSGSVHLPASLWEGTTDQSVRRNVPGVAIYFYALSAIRTELSLVPYFQVRDPSSPSSSASGTDPSSSRSALVRLSSQGNLVAGAIARTSVGFVLNPITVLKARYEVCPDILSRGILLLHFSSLGSFNTRTGPLH